MVSIFSGGLQAEVQEELGLLGLRKEDQARRPKGSISFIWFGLVHENNFCRIIFSYFNTAS